MKYLLVAHPEPGGIVHLPPEWGETPVDHAAHTACCDTTRNTCERLLQGMNLTPASLDTYLRLVTTPCLGRTASLHDLQALGFTSAVRKWLARYNPQHGLIVGGAREVNAVLLGMCDDLKDYLIPPGRAVLVEIKGTQPLLTFYKPRR
ncbi:hypothetical protein KBD61_06410 [Patescibacteria group bacterium]|nr:hypothetical protein [Patescibacteria group bacterium]